MSEETSFTVYAMKLQPGGADPDTNPFAFCRSEEIIGVGWAVDYSTEYDSVEQVYKGHEKVVQHRADQGKSTERILADGRLKAPIRYILKGVDKGDYVWVNENDQFALCRVESDWRVTPNLEDDVAEQYNERDIQQFRDVDWIDIPYSLVPGYVRRKFSRPFGTAVEMDDGITQGSKEVIKSLHAQENLSSENDLNRSRVAEKVERADTERVFDILGPMETEDIVISYLQSKGWRIIKSSTSESEAEIECEMRREEAGESVLGYLQVKTGSAGVYPEAYNEYAEAGQMIFFVQSGVDVEDKENMTAITPETIHEYMVTDYNYLPNESLLKLDFALE